MPCHPSFAEVLSRVDDVEGWMTEDQAWRLFERSCDLGPGTTIVEIGSFRGRSMIVLASAAGNDTDLIAIDPHAGNDRGPQEIAADQTRGDDDFEAFNSNLAAAGIADRVTHVRKMSNEALGDVEGDIDLLYIDGAHRFGPARADIRDWGNRVSGGGTMLIHDSFSSIGVSLALVTTTFFGSRWRYVGRSQSMAEYQRENMEPAERLANAGRQIAQLPWFLRNVIIKALLVAKLGKFTKIFGHHTEDWPY